MYWKVTYRYWCSVEKSVGYVKADTENEAWRKFDSHFGYEEIDIVSVELISADEILKSVVYDA